ncbi:MAG: hypothetical protein SWH78_11395 [Thermodesulfobacteriota bacterium]|nr:hypothetical protein [Thermodesulfobacteriota bacterium]
MGIQHLLEHTSKGQLLFLGALGACIGVLYFAYLVYVRFSAEGGATFADVLRTIYKVAADSPGISALLLTAGTVFLGVMVYDLLEKLSELVFVVALGVFLFWYYVMLFCKRNRGRD